MCLFGEQMFIYFKMSIIKKDLYKLFFRVALNKNKHAIKIFEYILFAHIYINTLISLLMDSVSSLNHFYI